MLIKFGANVGRVEEEGEDSLDSGRPLSKVLILCLPSPNEPPCHVQVASNRVMHSKSENIVDGANDSNGSNGSNGKRQMLQQTTKP